MPYPLVALAYSEGIKVEYWDFEPPLEGVYWKSPGLPPIIGMSKRVFGSRRHFRSVLAEELGHHFTTAGCHIPGVQFHYTDRLDVSRAEHRAAKWAAEYLVPEDKLLDALERGIGEAWQLAEHFDVDEELVRLRLRML